MREQRVITVLLLVKMETIRKIQDMKKAEEQS